MVQERTGTITGYVSELWKMLDRHKVLVVPILKPPSPTAWCFWVCVLSGKSLLLSGISPRPCSGQLLKSCMKLTPCLAVCKRKVLDNVSGPVFGFSRTFFFFFYMLRSGSAYFFVLFIPVTYLFSNWKIFSTYFPHSPPPPPWQPIEPIEPWFSIDLNIMNIISYFFFVIIEWLVF